jgi:hypothetical protein
MKTMTQKNTNPWEILQQSLVTEIKQEILGGEKN